MRQNPEYLLNLLRSYRGRLGYLKSQIEYPDSGEIYDDHFDEIDELWSSIEETRRALAAIGNGYKPPLTVRKALAFAKSLRSIETLHFTVDGRPFQGYEDWTFKFDPDSQEVLVDGCTSCDPPGAMVEDFVSKIGKDEMIQGLERLHLEDWEEDYNSSILAGTKWSLEIRFRDGRKDLRIEGLNNYPYNFDDLLDLLDVEWFY